MAPALLWRRDRKPPRQEGHNQCQDGLSRWALEIIADEIHLLTPKPNNAVPEAVAA